MQESIKQLLVLQEQDLELDRLRASVAAIPKSIADVKKQIEVERLALENSKKELTHLQVQRKGKEIDLETKEGEVRKHTAELNSIKSNDAYRAMLGEIEKVKTERSALEDEILQVMEKVDQAQRVWKDLETVAKTTESTRQQQIAELESKQKNLEEQVAQKQKDRDVLSQGYPAALIKKYEHLRNGKTAAVIVPLRNEQCSGCHMRVSQNLVNEVKRGQTVMSCEHCSRLVYLEEATQEKVG